MSNEMSGLRRPTRLHAAWLGVLSLVALGACQKAASPAPAAAAAATQTAPAAAVAATDGCPDDGARLPISHVCQGRAINYLDPALKLIHEAPADCAWTMNEAAFPLPGGDGVLLYRALRCKGVTTTLEFHGGAHSAALGYTASALYPDAVKDGIEPVRIFGDGARDPRTAIEELKAGIPKAERASCELRPAGIDTWPADALVIAPNAAARAKHPKDEPLAACGEFGVDEDSQTFWRTAQGYAWFFNMGQDTMDFDPVSLLLMGKNAAGEWEAMK